MTNEKKGLQNTLNSAKESLENINQEKYPKLYESKQGEIKALEIAIDKETWAKKAEKQSKDTPQETTTPKKEETDTPKNYSLQDIRALNDVHDEDVERVEKFAKMEDISISEAKQNADLKAILKNRAEERKTAAAANTGSSKRGESKVSSSKLLEKFDKGEYPESDADIGKLAEARLKQKEKSR